MPLNSKELVDLIDAVTKKNSGEGKKSDGKSKATSKPTAKASDSKPTKSKATEPEKPTYKPKPKVQVRKPAKPTKDNTQLDPTHPDKKTKSQARRCLDNIEKCVRKDPRYSQQLGINKKDYKDDEAPPVVVPMEGDKKHESFDRSMNYSLGYRKPLKPGQGLRGGRDRLITQYSGLPTSGTQSNISKSGTPQELVRKLRSIFMSMLRPQTVGHYRVDIEVTEGMLFAEVQFNDPQELKNNRLEMQVSQMAKKTFAAQARTNDVEVEFHRKGWMLNGITISVENIGVQDFTHSVDSRNLGRTQG